MSETAGPLPTKRIAVSLHPCAERSRYFSYRGASALAAEPESVWMKATMYWHPENWFMEAAWCSLSNSHQTAHLLRAREVVYGIW